MSHLQASAETLAALNYVSKFRTGGRGTGVSISATWEPNDETGVGMTPVGRGQGDQHRFVGVTSS